MITVRRYVGGKCPIVRALSFEDFKAEAGWSQQDWGSDNFVWTREVVEEGGEKFIEVIWDDPEAFSLNPT